MILSDYKDFPRMGRIISLDWGLRRCGVAVSDENRDFTFARPQLYIKSQPELIQKVLDIFNEDKISGIVIGLPLYSDGSESDTTKMVREFADNLAKYTDLPIVFVEENLTSAAATEEIGRKSISKIKQELDSVSAKIILENAIAILKRI
ncbi:MAG: Holliday junction resolvase RuvX [Alphaproteobacteria bacterium]|nr:Holliday junction resolvase RuvX [Alphaproteobacteria bacterium]